MRALSAHPDFVEDLVPMCLKVCTWAFVDNFAALVRMEEEMTHVDMPKRPESAKIVKEFMLLEGEHKVSKLWKPGQKIQVDRDANVGDDVYLKKQLNLEVIVMDEAIKSELKARWMEKVPSNWLQQPRHSRERHLSHH
ncbi:hypothetical protein JVT61DRAFT_12129 [Boletus reticuloceps]|uniref:Uncharacterized protein n=1 Tax=Boletus reticuloceps TaxID=495285 RepID=A0A8I2YER1_9AGAM|nr:hypothetical protein JVT61DRAFT_12129 [Boletus reticuloceps]